jgi:hypothetical protein
MNLYNTNSYFHSFITAIEMALVGFITSYSGGLPTTKTAWATVAAAVGGALWGALRNWLATNVATQARSLKA